MQRKRTPAALLGAFSALVLAAGLLVSDCSPSAGFVSPDNGPGTPDAFVKRSHPPVIEGELVVHPPVCAKDCYALSIETVSLEAPFQEGMAPITMLPPARPGPLIEASFEPMPRAKIRQTPFIGEFYNRSPHLWRPPELPYLPWKPDKPWEVPGPRPLLPMGIALAALLFLRTSNSAGT